jgi:hypothetical protein
VHPQKVESLQKMKKCVRRDPSKKEGSNGGNQKPRNTWKTTTEHPKKIFESCRSIAFVVQR